MREEEDMRTVRPSGVIAGLLVLLLASTATAQQEYPDPGTFTIDWNRQVIITNSLGVPNTNLPQASWRTSAVRAARLTAARDLLEALKGIAITSTTTVENAMVTSDVIRSKVEGIVRDFVILDTKYYESMDVGYVVEMSLTGALVDALLPEDTGSRAPARTGGGGTGVRPGGGVVSGLIVDASGLTVTPAMAPKILDEAGQVVYGTELVNREYAVQIGVAGYHNDLAAARQSERVAGNPLVVKALRTAGPNRCDLVIATADADRIRQLAGNQPFLDQCKVMIIVHN
jgi:hypothetical protein